MGGEWVKGDREKERLFWTKAFSRSDLFEIVRPQLLLSGGSPFSSTTLVCSLSLVFFPLRFSPQPPWLEDFGT